MPKLQTCLSDIEWDPKYGASRIPLWLLLPTLGFSCWPNTKSVEIFIKTSWYIRFRPNLTFCSLLVAVISHQNQRVIVQEIQYETTPMHLDNHANDISSSIVCSQLIIDLVMRATAWHGNTSPHSSKKQDDDEYKYSKLLRYYICIHVC
jgi:hypothetical protein